MEQIPGDMVYEIMRRLQGPDIVRFGRACKRFWAIYCKKWAKFNILKVTIYKYFDNYVGYTLTNTRLNLGITIYHDSIILLDIYDVDPNSTELPENIDYSKVVISDSIGGGFELEYSIEYGLFYLNYTGFPKYWNKVYNITSKYMYFYKRD